MQIAKADPEPLVAALESLFRVFRTAATAGELSLPAASVLGRLVRDGRQRLTDLAAAERVSQPAMTQLVARLERDGLARKVDDASDGRAVLVAVTGKGRRVSERRRAERVELVRGLLAELDAVDVQAIAAGIPALQRMAGLSEKLGPLARTVAVTR